MKNKIVYLLLIVAWAFWLNYSTIYANEYEWLGWNIIKNSANNDANSLLEAVEKETSKNKHYYSMFYGNELRLRNIYMEAAKKYPQDW